MEDITKLITLDEDESILGIFPQPFSEKMKIEDLVEKYHHIEDLPPSFFHIDKKYISYTFTHIFTDKRYIAIGVNFWQIFDPTFVFMKEKINFQNFMLSIPRKEFVSYEIKIGLFNNIISLGNLVVLDCATKSFYLQIKEFLIKSWEFSATEFEEKENKNLLKLKRIYLISNMMEYAILSYPLLIYYSKLITEAEYYRFFLVWVIILSIFAFGTIIKSIVIGINLRKKKAILSLHLRIYFFGWFALHFGITLLSLF